MIAIKKKSVLSGILVLEAMRRQVVSLPVEASLGKSVNALIKFKVNAILVRSDGGVPQGVVSGTDLMAAFYAGLPLETELGAVLSSPLLTCFPDDKLEDGLSMMLEQRIHQIYVQGEHPGSIIGILAYSDIVGLLYRYCWACKQSLHKLNSPDHDGQAGRALRVEEVMTPGPVSCPIDQSLERIIEVLSEKRFGAVLIHSDDDPAAGVISTTDLVLAYAHGLTPETRAGEIMSAPVLTCQAFDPLTTALQRMLLRDTKRIFISSSDSPAVIGLLSLSDAARFRSGSCKACLAGRMMA